MMFNISRKNIFVFTLVPSLIHLFLDLKYIYLNLSLQPKSFPKLFAIILLKPQFINSNLMRKVFCW